VVIYAGGTPFTAKLGFLKIWSEMGLVGLFLFSMFFVDVWIKQRLMQGNRFLPLIIVALFTYMIVNTISSFYFIVGMVMSVTVNQSRERY